MKNDKLRHELRNRVTMMRFLRDSIQSKERQERQTAKGPLGIILNTAKLHKKCTKLCDELRVLQEASCHTIAESRIVVRESGSKQLRVVGLIVHLLIYTGLPKPTIARVPIGLP